MCMKIVWKHTHETIKQLNSERLGIKRQGVREGSFHFHFIFLFTIWICLMHLLLVSF